MTYRLDEILHKDYEEMNSKLKFYLRKLSENSYFDKQSRIFKLQYEIQSPLTGLLNKFI